MTQGRYRFGEDGDVRHIAGWMLVGLAIWAVLGYGAYHLIF